MLRKSADFVILAIVAALLTWQAPIAFSQDAKTVLGNASKAMGAGNLKTIEYSGTASEFAFGQAVNPSSPWPVFAEKSYTRTINYDAPAWRVERVLADIPPDRRGGGLPPGPTQTVVVGPNTPWAVQMDLWMTPYGFLREAASNSATVASKSMGGKKYTVVTFTAPNKAKMNGYIDAQNMLDRVETWVDTPMLGDTLMEADYSGYKDFGGVKFPTTIEVKEGAFPILDVSVTDVKPNAPANLQGNPAGNPPTPPATSQKLADGVYLILPAYAALAVDFKDYIVIIEGPQSEERANAVIAEAKKDIPNKPIKYVVNTHNHFDHSGGLRTFIAEGATIITHQQNEAYFKKIFSLPHTLDPDRQAEAKKKISIETMTDKKVLTDGNHVIELHRLQGSNHNDGLIVAYLPKEKILVEADAFNPPAQPNAPPNPPTANNMNLVQNIDRLKLDVETIIPIHYPADGRKVTTAELMRAVGKGN
jgi:glyoxylase-like metal-dependent hydrolase (beta-lactamase superfamily II)